MSDPVFLITGASSGIGAATARAAADAGYRVVLAARSTDKPDELAAELGGQERALARPLRRHRMGRSSRRWSPARSTASGRIDVVFANAGFGAKRGFLEESPEQWRAMVLTNVYGAALTIRATIEALRESRGPSAC